MPLRAMLSIGETHQIFVTRMNGQMSEQMFVLMQTFDLLNQMEGDSMRLTKKAKTATCMLSSGILKTQPRKLPRSLFSKNV